MICLLVASITYVIGQMQGVGIAFGRFLEIDAFWGLLIGCLCGLSPTLCFGGMKGVTYTQVAQYCVLITAYTIPAVFISLQLTGNTDPGAGSLWLSTPSSGEPLLVQSWTKSLLIWALRNIQPRMDRPSTWCSSPCP